MAIASSSSSISSQEIIINKKSRSSSSSSSSNSSVDRLTSLPDSLRLHILSLLPYQSAVRTSALSSAWRHLYKSRAHNLTFNLLGPTSDLAAYAGTIDTLRLYCRRSSFLLPSVGYCNSSSRRICDLTLRLFDNSLDLNGDTAITFAFPPSLFRLTVINLHLVLPPPQFPITFPFLEILNLERVCIADHALKAVLAGCMSLRTLDIRLCAGLSEIVVPGRGLGVRSVTIVDCPQLTKLRIEGRHLRRFHFFGNGFLEGCRFDEACKLELEDVYMSYGVKKAAEEEDDEEDDEEEDELERQEEELPQGWFASWWIALGRLQHIKVLTLCDVSLRYVAASGDFRNFPCLRELQLVMRTVTEYVFMDIWNFFRLCFCPGLEKLFIKFWPQIGDLDSVELLNDVKDPPAAGIFANLKMIKIIGFEGHQYQMLLVKILLWKAACLESLFIVAPPVHNSLDCHSHALRFLQMELDSMVKLSGNAKIVVREHDDHRVCPTHDEIYC